MYTELLNKEPIYIPKETTKPGIILRGEDLLILHQIYIHSTMRSTSIHEIYQCTYTKEIDRNNKWISNRLRKLASAGLIEQLKENITALQLSSLVCYHYWLDNLGY